MQYVPKNIINKYFPEVIAAHIKEKGAIPIEFSLSSSFKIDFTEETISLSNALLFVKSITSQNWVFINWIAEMPVLENLLLGELPKLSFLDKFKWQEHELFESFKDFISPYLESALLNTKNSTQAEIAVTSSYFCLLNSTARSFVEFSFTKEFISASREVIKLFISDTSTKTFDSSLLLLCNDDIVKLFYHIGPSNYALKIEYSELIFELVKHPLCERKTLLWIIRMLEKTGLRDEHLLQLKTIQNGSLSNTLNLSSNNHKESVSIKLIVVIILFLIIPISIWYFTQLNKYSIAEKELLDRRTSFEQFTTNERKKIDSLLRHIQSKSRNEEEIDADFSNTRVNIMAGIKNKKMSLIYKDLLLDLENINYQLKDSCTNFLDETNLFYQNTKSLKNRNASQSLFIKNGSDYEVLICVFKEEKLADVYSFLLKKDKTTTFKLEVGETILFLPGKKFSSLTRYDTAGPSESFLGHFCEKDENYSTMLTEFYTFNPTKKSKSKLYLSGDQKSYFNILDLGSVLQLN